MLIGNIDARQKNHSGNLIYPIPAVEDDILCQNVEKLNEVHFEIYQLPLSIASDYLKNSNSILITNFRLYSSL